MQKNGAALYLALTGILMAALLAVGAWLFVRESDEAGISAFDYPIEDLSFTSLDASPADIVSVEAPLRIVTTWATWCSLCLGHLNALVELKRELGDDVAIIAVNRDEPKATQEAYLSRQGLLNAGIMFFLDDADSLYGAIGGYDMPETLFMASDDTIVAHERSVMRLEELRVEAQTALAKQ